MKSTHQNVQGNVRAFYDQKIKEVQYIEKELTEMLYPKKTEVWNWLDFADIESSDRFQELLKKLEAIQVTPSMEISMQLPYQALGTQLAQLQYQIQNFQTEFRSLYYKKQILEAILISIWLFFAERSDKSNFDAGRNFGTNAEIIWFRIVQTESELETRYFAPPSLPKTNRSFQTRAAVQQTSTDAQAVKLLQSKLERTLSKTMLSRRTSGWEVCALIIVRHEALRPFRPVETQKDHRFFLVQNTMRPFGWGGGEDIFKTFTFKSSKHEKQVSWKSGVTGYPRRLFTKFRPNWRNGPSETAVRVPDASAVISASEEILPSH